MRPVERLARTLQREDEPRSVGYGRLLFVLGVVWGVVAMFVIQVVAERL